MGSSSDTSKKNRKQIVLFDVDGTLTPARQEIKENMISKLKALKEITTIGVVGGSDLAKQKEQLGPETLSGMYDFNFAENGVVAYKEGKLINATSITDYLGETKVKEYY